MKLTVHFLGKPEIFMNQQKIEVPQKKLQALLFYILFHGTCTRDELSSMFWEELEPEDARRNLRNSLYKLKSCLDSPILLTKGKELLLVNPEIELIKDTDMFLMEDGEKYMLQIESCVFLNKFQLKNCREFQLWVQSLQNTYEKLFVDRLLPAMKKFIDRDDYISAEDCAKKILSVDGYQEQACRTLMQIYSSRGDYNQALHVYSAFQALLAEELDTEPDRETKELYEKILLIKKRHSLPGKPLLHEEHMEVLAEIQQEYKKYISHTPSDFCILSGSIGMGKSRVLSEFLTEISPEQLICAELHASDRFVDYSAIEKIAEAICCTCKIPSLREPDIPYFGSEDVYYRKSLEQLIKVLRKKPLPYILLIKNMESMDKHSFHLLLSCFLEKYRGEFFMLAEYCYNFQSQSFLLERLRSGGHMKIIKLEPLSEEKCREFLIKLLEDKYPSSLSSREVFQYTGGNLGFLKNVADNIRRNQENIFALNEETSLLLTQVFCHFDPEEYEYLEYLSILENGTDVHHLSRILRENPVTVMKILDSLMSRKIIKESASGKSKSIQFCEKMTRDFVYQNISSFKKLELHKMAAQYYETLYLENKNNYLYLKELCYQYHFLEDEYKKLYYDIFNLEYILDYYDEFFPTVVRGEDMRNKIRLNRDEIYQNVVAYTQRLEGIEDEIDFRDYEELHMTLDFLSGRSLTRDGKRKQGIVFIQAMLRRAGELKRTDMLLKGYIELICYGLKEDNTQWMSCYLEEAKKVPDFEKHEREKGILLRLEGYCNILLENYTQAENLLWASIRLFETPKMKRKNYFNVAGAYDYLALIYRKKGEFEKAEQAIAKAIQICRERNVSKSLDLFYEDYGYILFLQNRYQEAEKYFKLSSKIYDELGTYWLRSVGESCMSVIQLSKGNKEAALEHFRRAEIFSQKDMAKEELDALEKTRNILQAAKILNSAKGRG